MSTSYCRLIISIAGLLSISTSAMADKAKAGTEYARYPNSAICRIGLNGVPSAVYFRDVAELEDNKDNVKHHRDIADILKSEAGGYYCEAANEDLSPAAASDKIGCPAAATLTCAKNLAAGDGRNPHGYYHDLIVIEPGEAKKGLESALNKHKTEFDDTTFPRSMTGHNDWTNHDDTRQVDSFISAWSFGGDLYKPGTAPGSVPPPPPPAPPAPPAPPVPAEVYGPTVDNSNCADIGDKDCTKANNCLTDHKSVFAETCASTCDMYQCLNDYNSFCSKTTVCGSGEIPTLKTPPADMQAKATTAIEALDKLRKDNLGNNVKFGQCALLEALTVTAPGEKLDPNLARLKDKNLYPNCLRGDVDVELQEFSFDYLDKVLRAFANPGAYHDPTFKADHIALLATGLARLGSVNATDFFAALGITPTATNLADYQALVDSIKPLTGPDATEVGMRGTTLGFAIATNGGHGYLGVTPAAQSSTIGSENYLTILKKSDKLYCLQTPNPPPKPPFANKTNQDAFLEAIKRDRNIAKRIKSVVESKYCISGGAKHKAGGLSSQPRSAAPTTSGH